MAAENASLDPMTEVDPNFIYRPHAQRPHRKRDSHETSMRKQDPPAGGALAGVGWGSTQGEGREKGRGRERRGVWMTIGGRSYSGRSRTPAQLRYERSTTSGSRPSLDVAEVEADARREDSDLDLDLSLFNKDGPQGARTTERVPPIPAHIDFRPPDSVDAMDAKTAHHFRHKKRSPEGSREDQAKTEAEVTAMLDAYSRFLWAAVVKGNLAAVRGVYKEKKVLYIDHHGNTALHLAARMGQVNILKWLLRYSGVRVTMRNSRSETCAHVAAKHGHVTCLRHILFGGAARPLVLASDRDRQGLTPIHLAAIVGNQAAVRWLVNTFGAPVGAARNNLGQTPLHFAAAKGCVKSTEALCRLGDEAINTRDNVGCTPVYYAAQEGQVLTLRHLVDVAGAKITIATQDGLRPLHAACQTGRVDIVHFLLQRGESEADLGHQTQDGATVFHMASANGQTDTLALLLRQKGAERALRMRDCKGSSPAHDAAENGHTECLKLLYAAGLDMHQPDEDGETPYSLASRSSSQACVSYSKVLKHRPPSDITLLSVSESSESPESEIINRDLLNEELSKEELLILMDSELKKRKRVNAGKENTTMPKDKRGLLQRIKDKFDDDKHLTEAYERNLQILKKEFILRSLTDLGKEKDAKTNVSYKQSNRPAAVNMPPGGESLILKQMQHGSDLIDTESDPGSPKSNTWNAMSFHMTDMVPSGTTRSLRNLAAKIRRDTIEDDEHIDTLLNVSSALTVSEKAGQNMNTTSSSPESNFSIPTKENPQSYLPGLHEVMTQTYADPRDIYKVKTIDENLEYQHSISTQTVPSETKATEFLSPPRSPILESPIVPKRAPKLKNLSEYRPLKDKVSLEFESIPEAESNNSSFEKHSVHSGQELHHLDYADRTVSLSGRKGQIYTQFEPNNIYQAQNYDTNSKRFETLRPPDRSVPLRSQQKEDTRTWPQNSSPSKTIPKEEYKSFGNARKQIHPKIEKLRAILDESGVIIPYEDHKRCQFPLTSRPQSPNHDPNQLKSVAKRLSPNELSAIGSLPQSPAPPPPPPPPHPPPPPPPPPPIPIFLSMPKPQVSQAPTFYLLTSQSDTAIDWKANSTPSSSATSGYISPDMRSSPPLISSLKDQSHKFNHQSVGALQGHNVQQNEQGSGAAEGPGGKNSGNENTKEQQYWPPGFQPSNSPTLPINVPNNHGSTPWNISLRRVPPQKEKANPTSELEQYFKILEQRRKMMTGNGERDVENLPN